MRQTRHFESVRSIKTAQEIACIAAMIADLKRIVAILDCDVVTEEEQSRVSERSDARYSILARTLAARRDNLERTILTLETRMPPDAVALSEAA